MRKQMRNQFGRLVLLAFFLPSCAGAGAFTWVQDLPASEQTSEATSYVIGAGDMLNVQVFDQEKMSARQRVRRDGKIALPFLGEVEVKGRRPAELARELEERFKAYIVTPRIVVVVEETRPVVVSVLGEVTRPGAVTLDPPGSVLQALALAGGTSDYADRDRIFVLRRGATLRRIRFTYEALVHNDSRAVAFALQQGDVVVVE